ncbi:MAG: cache domain-containing protein [Geobacteraceae bacterium]|nr:cache domain-containing protein [Geobacteraceae bacterium]
MRNLCLLFFSFLFIVYSAEAANQPLILTTAEQQVAAAFDRLDTGLKKAAGELSTTGLTGEGARQVLSEACKEFSYAVDCATVDTKGRLTTIEPADYRRFEGADISAQEQVKQMLKLHKPVMSQVFRSVEGYDTVDVQYPLFNPEGRFIGSVSIMFKPERFLGEIIQPLVKGARLDISVMDIGGRTLYDSDPAQVGLNILTSSVFQPYTEFVQLARKIAATPQGDGAYRFKKENLTGPDADKKAYWTSVSLYGVAWRLVGIILAADKLIVIEHKGPDTDAVIPPLDEAFRK